MNVSPSDVQFLARKRVVVAASSDLGGDLGGFSLSKLLGKAGDILGQYGGAVGSLIGGDYSGAANQVLTGLVNTANANRSAGTPNLVQLPMVQGLLPQQPQQQPQPPVQTVVQGDKTFLIVAGVGAVLLVALMMRRR